MPQTPNVDAGLAKRLAEAADSFRDGKYHYFVCKTIFPYDLHYTAGFDSSLDASNEADTILKDLTDYYKFGPYKTEALSQEIEPLIKYDSIEIRFLQKGDEVYAEALPNNVDAIILSIPAYDKFFQPYYVSLYGIQNALDIRSSVVEVFTSSPESVITHLGAGRLQAGGKGGTRIIAGNYQVG
jgi:hypothetical protein